MRMHVYVHDQFGRGDTIKAKFPSFYCDLLQIVHVFYLSQSILYKYAK